MDDPIGIVQSQRLLLDGAADVRKKGVQIVAARVARLFTDIPFEGAIAVVTAECGRIDTTFLKSTTATFRRGGLACARAVVLGLPTRQLSSDILRTLVTMVLDSFTDVDATVRIVALEAFHDLLVRFKNDIARPHLRKVFLALASAVSDRDWRVAILAQECSSTLREIASVDAAGSSGLDVPQFVAVVCEVLYTHGDTCRGGASSSTSTIPPTLPWTLEWLQCILDLPAAGVIHHLAKFLPPLLRVAEDFPAALEVLSICRVQWSDVPECLQRTAELVPALATAVEQCGSVALRRLALGWLADLISASSEDARQQEDWENLLSTMVLALLPQLGSGDVEIRIAAQTVNHRLMQLYLRGHPVHDASIELSTVQTEPLESGKSVLNAVLDCLANGVEDTRLASLEWLLLLLSTQPALAQGDGAAPGVVFERTLQLLGDAAVPVQHKAVDVLCAMMKTESLGEMMHALLGRIHEAPALLFPCMPLIFAQLQAHYESRYGPNNCDTLLATTCAALSTAPDKRFTSKCVVILNALLLTNKDFTRLRSLLRRASTDTHARKTFVLLCTAWQLSAVPMLSLCLLCGAYNLAARVCQVIGESEVSPATLLQLDRLVQLLESPTFTFLRLSLLDLSNGESLAQTLFSILMIMPLNSPQYTTLYRRLKTLPRIERSVTSSSSDWLSAESEHVISDFIVAQSTLVQYEQSL